MEQMGAETGESMKQTPIYELYAGIAPRPEDWPTLWAKIGDLLRQDYDWSADVATLTMPTMLVFGDADSVSPAHAADFFGLLGGRLTVVLSSDSARTPKPPMICSMASKS